MIEMINELLSKNLDTNLGKQMPVYLNLISNLSVSNRDRNIKKYIANRAHLTGECVYAKNCHHLKRSI